MLRALDFRSEFDDVYPAELHIIDGHAQTVFVESKYKIEVRLISRSSSKSHAPESVSHLKAAVIDSTAASLCHLLNMHKTCTLFCADFRSRAHRHQPDC